MTDKVEVKIHANWGERQVYLYWPKGKMYYRRGDIHPHLAAGYPFDEDVQLGSLDEMLEKLDALVRAGEI